MSSDEKPSANGTLSKVVINDQITGTSTAKLVLMDMTAGCASPNVTCGTFWVQNFTYDAFGNISKTVPQGDGGAEFPSELLDFAANQPVLFDPPIWLSHLSPRTGPTAVRWGNRSYVENKMYAVR